MSPDKNLLYSRGEPSPTVPASSVGVGSRFQVADDLDRRKAYDIRREQERSNGGLLTNSITKRWVGLGSVISIFCGVVAGLVFKNLSFGILLGVLGEGISLTLGLHARVNELEGDLILRLREHNELFSLVHRVAQTDDPPLTQRFNALTHALWEIREGRYKLNSLEEVYEDDKQSIRALQHHEILRSTCPVRGNEADVNEQFHNKSLLGSIEAHKDAAERGVLVVRVFSFENKALSDLPLVKAHMDELESAEVECFCVFPNEPEFSQVRQVHTDFVIFGTTKVSVGILSSKGVVGGADVYYDDVIIKYYKDQFRILIDLGDRHKCTRTQSELKAEEECTSNP